jgi:hypothetical protein
VSRKELVRVSVMTRKETPVESLRGYLRELTPQTRARLLAEIERRRGAGEDVPGADLILTELRAEPRKEARPVDRLDPAAQHFFRLMEPYLTGRPAERANAAQLSRASLPPIWEWIVRDLMASMARAYTDEMKGFVTAGKQRELEQAVQAFQNKAVKYLDGTLVSASGLEQARARLAARGGTPATFDDLAKMLRVLKAREALVKFAQGQPARIKNFVGTQLEKTRAALDAFAADHGEAMPFALAVVARRLTAPWQLIRLATKAATTKDADEIAATPYAFAVTMVLDRLDDQLDILRAALKAEHIVRAKELLTEIYDTEYALRVRIDLDDTAWGDRLDATVEAVTRALESEANNFPAGLRHVLQSSRLKRHQTLMGQLTRLGWKFRDALGGVTMHGRQLVATVRSSQAWSLFH